MIVDVAELAKWATMLVGIIAALKLFSSPVLKYTKQTKEFIDSNKKQIEANKDDIEDIKSWNDKQQGDINEIKENNLYQNKALLAIAKSMKEKGFNHTIDVAIDTLEDAILRQQSKPHSYNDRK